MSIVDDKPLFPVFVKEYKNYRRRTVKDYRHNRELNILKITMLNLAYENLLSFVINGLFVRLRSREYVELKTIYDEIVKKKYLNDKLNYYSIIFGIGFSRKMLKNLGSLGDSKINPYNKIKHGYDWWDEISTSGFSSESELFKLSEDSIHKLILKNYNSNTQTFIDSLNKIDQTKYNFISGFEIRELIKRLKKDIKL